MRAELTHSDLMKMFPNLKRTTFDAIMDDPSCIYTGEVVAVRDSKLNIIPYINTQKNFLETEEFNSIMSNEWDEDTTTWTKEKNKVKHAVKYDLKDLTVYELTVLMELYSKTGQWHDYEVVRKTLIGREDSGRANKKSKQLALKRSMKRINNDEY